jgi:hypothetical protein
MKLRTTITMHLIVAVMFATLAWPLSVYAVDPTISASVYDGQPATVTITNQQNNSTVYSSMLLLKGAVRNISQIMVYIDNVYSMTYALDSGATMYSFTTSVSEGEHVIKLVAVNPYDGTTTETSISITYTPGEQPLPAEAVKNVSEGAQVTKQYFEDQVNQASGAGPAKVISDAAYSFMKAVDLVPATAAESLPRTITRFVAVTVGLLLLLFSGPIITFYHYIRYQMLQWKIHALPLLVHRHAKLVLRILGALSLLGAFVI